MSYTQTDVDQLNIAASLTEKAHSAVHEAETKVFNLGFETARTAQALDDLHTARELVHHATTELAIEAKRIANWED